jgi:hypothetical protein
MIISILPVGSFEANCYIAKDYSSTRVTRPLKSCSISPGKTSRSV